MLTVPKELPSALSLSITPSASPASSTSSLSPHNGGGLLQQHIVLKNNNNSKTKKYDTVLRLLAVWIGICSITTIVIQIITTTVSRNRHQYRNRQGTSKDLSTNIKEAGTSPLVYIPVQPFYACNGRIEKVVCNNTILFESLKTSSSMTNEYNDSDDYLERRIQRQKIPIPSITDPKIKNYVCNALLLNGEKQQDVHIVMVPVCIQASYDSHLIGVLAHYSETAITRTSGKSPKTNSKLRIQRQLLHNTNNKQMKEQLLFHKEQEQQSMTMYTSTSKRPSISITNATKTIQIRLVESLYDDSDNDKDSIQSIINAMIMKQQKEEENKERIASSYSTADTTPNYSSKSPTQGTVSYRIVPLKYIDFPRHYRTVASYDEYERFRNWENYGELIWRYGSTTMFNPITVHNKVNNVDNSWDLWSDEYYNTINPNTNFTKLFGNNVKQFDALILSTSSYLEIESTTNKNKQKIQQQQQQLSDHANNNNENRYRTILEGMTQRIQVYRNTVPSIIMGLGVQMKVDQTTIDYYSKNNVINVNEEADNSTDNNVTVFNRMMTSMINNKYQMDFINEITSTQLSKKSTMIGLRGDISKSIICENDVNDTNDPNNKSVWCESLGCPSLTISRDRNLGRTIQDRYNAIVQRLQPRTVVNNTDITATTTSKDDVVKFQSTTNKKLRIAFTIPSSNVFSSPLLSSSSSSSVDKSMEFYANLIEQYNNQENHDEDRDKTRMQNTKKQTQHKVTMIKQAEHDLSRLRDYLTSDKWQKLYRKNGAISRIKRYDKDHAVTIESIDYSNAESWISDATKFDVIIASRIESAMAFIASGIPAIVIPTDVQVYELVQAMHIPYVLPNELHILLRKVQQHQQHYYPDNNNDQKTKTSSDHNINFYNEHLLLFTVLTGAQNTNFTQFEINRRNKLRGWNKLLSNVGLEMDPELKNIFSR